MRAGSAPPAGDPPAALWDHGAKPISCGSRAGNCSPQKNTKKPTLTCSFTFTPSTATTLFCGGEGEDGAVSTEPRCWSWGCRMEPPCYKPPCSWGGTGSRGGAAGLPSSSLPWCLPGIKPPCVLAGRREEFGSALVRPGKDKESLQGQQTLWDRPNAVPVELSEGISGGSCWGLLLPQPPWRGGERLGAPSRG